MAAVAGGDTRDSVEPNIADGRRGCATGSCVRACGRAGGAGGRAGGRTYGGQSGGRTWKKGVARRLTAMNS